MQTKLVNQVATSLEAKRHALDYWNVDGLPTIFNAASLLAIFFLLAAFVWAVTAIKDSELQLVILCLGAPVPVFVLALLSSRSEEYVERLKQRFTYPRTGYAAPPSQWNRAEREEASDASYGRFSAVARFLRKRWFLFYFPCLALSAINDIFEHPFHPSLGSRAAILISLGFLGALLRLPEVFRDRLVAIEIVGYPLLGLLAASALRKQKPLEILLLFAFGPPFLVLSRGVVTLIRYVQKNPMPPA